MKRNSYKSNGPCILFKQRLGLFLLFCCACLNTSFSQTLEKDSLRQLYYSNTTNIPGWSVFQEIDLLNELSKSYRYRNPDSLRYFGQKALDLSHSNNYEKGIITGTIRMGDYLSDIGKDDEAQQQYDEVELLLENFDDAKGFF